MLRFKAMRQTEKYKIACPEFFPTASFNLNDNRETRERLLNETLGGFKTAPAEAGMEWNLYPQKKQGIDRTDVVSIDEIVNTTEVEA